MKALTLTFPTKRKPDGKAKTMLTVLSLVKQGPKTYDQLWQSKRFKNPKSLRKALYALERAR